MTAPDALDLIADLGNTRAKLALFRGEELLERVSLVPGPELEAQCAAFLGARVPLRCAAASVSPPVASRLAAWCAGRGWRLRLLGQDLPSPVELAVREPSQVGADRIANAAWAARAYPGQAALVFDLGTAITLDAVDAAGRFCGGAIAAGISLRARALHEHTALLPRASLDEGASPPALGQTTLECLQGGLLWGSVGLVEVLARRARAELGDPLAPLILTGGDAPALARAWEGPIRVEPDLTLRGVLAALL